MGGRGGRSRGLAGGSGRLGVGHGRLGGPVGRGRDAADGVDARSRDQVLLILGNNVLASRTSRGGSGATEVGSGGEGSLLRSAAGSRSGSHAARGNLRRGRSDGGHRRGDKGGNGGVGAVVSEVDGIVPVTVSLLSGLENDVEGHCGKELAVLVSHHGLDVLLSELLGLGVDVARATRSLGGGGHDRGRRHGRGLGQRLLHVVRVVDRVEHGSLGLNRRDGLGIVAGGDRDCVVTRVVTRGRRGGSLRLGRRNRSRSVAGGGRGLRKRLSLSLARSRRRGRGAGLSRSRGGSVAGLHGEARGGGVGRDYGNRRRGAIGGRLRGGRLGGFVSSTVDDERGRGVPDARVLAGASTRRSGGVGCLGCIRHGRSRVGRSRNLGRNRGDRGGCDVAGRRRGGDYRGLGGRSLSGGRGRLDEGASSTRADDLTKARVSATVGGRCRCLSGEQRKHDKRRTSRGETHDVEFALPGLNRVNKSSARGC